MIKMETLVSNGHQKRDQNNYTQNRFTIQSDQPCRIEFHQGKDGEFIVWVYRGFHIDMEQEPVGVFDSHNGIENLSWIAFNPIENRDINLRDIVGDQVIEEYMNANKDQEGDQVNFDPKEIVKIAEPYLQQFGFKNIRYECHGQVPMVIAQKHNIDTSHDEDVYIRIL